jgi:hypothetical protein
MVHGTPYTMPDPRGLRAGTDVVRSGDKRRSAPTFPQRVAPRPCGACQVERSARTNRVRSISRQRSSPWCHIVVSIVYHCCETATTSKAMQCVLRRSRGRGASAVSRRPTAKEARISGSGWYERRRDRWRPRGQPLLRAVRPGGRARAAFPMMGGC